MFNKFVIPEVNDGFVTPAKKAVPYSVTIIGGPGEIVAWRKEQALMAEARAVATTKAYAVRREIAIKMIEAQDTTTLSLTPDEKEEIRLRNAMQDGVIVNGVTEERKAQILVETKKIPKELTDLQRAQTPELKSTWVSRLLSVPAKVWRNAFDPK